MERLTGGDIVARCLIEQGVPAVFGIPGALNIHLYHGLRRHRDRLRHVLVRNELGGAWMADGFARASGDVGVCVTVPGPGATHATSGIAGAYTDCSRVLLLSSQSEITRRGELRRDLFHGLDQQRLFSSITKWSAAVHRVEEIPEVLHEAFYRLRNGRPGPVQVELPADVLGHEADVAIPGRLERERPGIPAARATKVARLLRSAQRPLILAGDGVLHSEASLALSQFAARLGAPVITTVLGKSALPEQDPWSLGDMNSAAGSAAWGEADLIIAVGARFVQVDTRWPWFTTPARLVHIDSDAREINRVYPAEAGIVGDPRAVLEALTAALGEGEAGAGWRESFPQLKETSDHREAHEIVAALRAGAPDDTIACWDVCYPGFRSRADWFANEPRTYQYPGVYVGMGFGLPAGIGAKVARPERPVLVCAGDGGFQMTLAELATAAQHNIPLVVVVVNDGGLTLIRNVYDRAQEEQYEVDLVNPDFVQLAGAYGIPAERVTTPDELQAAVAAAFASSRLSFVEMRL